VHEVALLFERCSIIIDKQATVSRMSLLAFLTMTGAARAQSGTKANIPGAESEEDQL
jgi:hypothetical protein